jgi:hypothetical protein
MNGPGTVSIASGYTLTLNANYTITSSGLQFTGSGTLSIGSGYTLTLNNSVTWTLSVSGAGTLSVPSGYTLTLSANVTWSISSLSGSGTVNLGSGYTLTLNTNYTITSSSLQFTGSGTLAIGSGYTLTININITWTLSLSGSGTLSVPSGYTLTLGANITWSMPTFPTVPINLNGYTFTLAANYTITSQPANFSGSGALSVASGYTLTILNNLTWALNLAGAGTLSVPSGYTLTVSANATWSIANISGAGTLSVPSGYRLTQGAAMTISIPTITVAGTWANNGYGITIPSGATVSWKTTGSLTTASPAGTLTINGTLYYYGIALTWGSGDPGLPSFPLTLAGSGIGLFTTNTSSNGGNTIFLNAVTLSAGTNSSNTTTSSIVYPSAVLTSLSGSAVGKYQLEVYNSYDGYFPVALVYIGTANNNYSVNFTGVCSSGESHASYNIYARNGAASAGSITVTGTFYG